MTTEQIGNQKSWVEQRNEDLEKWEKSQGVINLSVDEECYKYLALTSEQRKKMTPDEAADASISISIYAGYINKLLQDLSSQIYLLDEKIRDIVLPRVNEQQAFKFEEKMWLAIAEDVVAKKMYREKIILTAKHTRISYYSNKIENIGKAFQYLANSKKRDRYE